MLLRLCMLFDAATRDLLNLVYAGRSRPLTSRLVLSVQANMIRPIWTLLHGKGQPLQHQWEARGESVAAEMPSPGCA